MSTNAFFYFFFLLNASFSSLSTRPITAQDIDIMEQVITYDIPALKMPDEVNYKEVFGEYFIEDAGAFELLLYAQSNTYHRILTPRNGRPLSNYAKIRLKVEPHLMQSPLSEVRSIYADILNSGLDGISLKGTDIKLYKKDNTAKFVELTEEELASTISAYYNKLPNTEEIIFYYKIDPAFYKDLTPKTDI